MPHCPFCDAKHKTRRGEHVIPKWITREFPTVDWSITNTLTKYNRKAERYIPITTPRPCSTCNTGWMSDLEQLAKPVLLPLIYGKPATLTLRDQVIVATWFIKTAMTYDLHSEKHAPRPGYFEAAEHRRLRSSLSFNTFYRFYTGRYSGARFFDIQETHSDVSIMNRDDLNPLGDPLRGYALTLIINKLVLQIFCVKAPRGTPLYAMDFGPSCIKLFESIPARWPASLDFDDPLLDKFIDRWTVEPPPPSF